MSRVALVAVWVLPTAKSPYPLEEQSTLLMPFECLNASWPKSRHDPRGPKLLVDMGMRVTAPGGLDKMMELYVAANLSKYLYTWDPIRKRAIEDSSRLNSFGCGPDTPLSEGTACLETYRVQLPPEMGFNESVDLDLHVDVAQNPNATCVWSVDRVYRSFAQFHKRGRGLCSNLNKVTLPSFKQGHSTTCDDSVYMADVSIIVHQYELKNNNSCPVAEYDGFSQWKLFYPEYSQVGIPKQFFFLRGWHEQRYDAEPVGLSVAGSSGAELAAAVIRDMENADAQASTMVAEGPRVLLHKVLLPAASGGALCSRGRDCH